MHFRRDPGTVFALNAILKVLMGKSTYIWLKRVESTPVFSALGFLPQAFWIRSITETLALALFQSHTALLSTDTTLITTHSFD